VRDAHAYQKIPFMKNYTFAAAEKHHGAECSQKSFLFLKNSTEFFGAFFTEVSY
jgi:hypothetical protein